MQIGCRENDMKELLLGIDIGTSACKAAIFRRDDEVVAAASEEYKVYYPQPGYAEQDPDEWWRAVCKAVKKCIGNGAVNPSDIAGIGVDGQSWSAVAIDKQGNVLARTPIWMDNRSDSVCERLNRKIGKDAIFQVSGNPLTAQYTTGKVLWYRENRPEVYRETDKILQSNAFIVYRLTGKVSLDICQSYGWHCFDMKRGVWDDDMRKELGIPEGFLPKISPCHEVIGTVTRKAAEESGLTEGIPVVAGALDAACGTLGAGVIRNGETQEQGGQAGGVSICTDTYKADPRLILSRYVIPGYWILQGGTTGGGGVMRWLERELGDYERMRAGELGRSSLMQFNEIAAEVAPGSEGLVFLPYMSGERTPIWDPDAKGVFYGLDFSKTKGHMIRAAMEGVAYSVRHNLEAAEEAGASAKVLRAMGGSANSLLWTQIKADITGKLIEVPDSDTATTLGAVMLAGVGVGLYKDFKEAAELTVTVRRVHKPNPEVKEVYDKNYRIYLELYQNLKETMKKQKAMNIGS